MRKFLSILLCALGFVYTGRAELNVEWIDDNTIVVTGYGYGDTTNDTALGSCTNCLAISPAEMRQIKDNIESLILDVDDVLRHQIEPSVHDILYVVSNKLQDISLFGRFPITDSNVSNLSTCEEIVKTSGVSYVHGSQGQLSDSFWASIDLNSQRTYSSVIGYANGIYDYANQHVAPDLSYIETYSQDILRSSQLASDKLSVVYSTVESITEDSCTPCGDGSGSSCSGCPCKEQWETLLDYIKHIDDDQHDRFKQLKAISNDVYSIDKRFDSYAKFVSGILYNDATIVVDDGENCWSNVYNTGHSDLYDYDKSNILQRIELLLYGLVSNTSTNWGSATSDVATDVEDMQDTIDDVKASVADANTEYTSEVNTISQKVTSLFNALNFFGSGSLGNFSYGEPMQFDVYDFQFDFTNSADFRPLQQVCRTAMQIFYWTAGVVFMLVFWYRVVKFTTDFALRIIHFFNNLLT